MTTRPSRLNTATRRPNFYGTQGFRSGFYIFPPVATTTQALTLNIPRATALVIPVDGTVTELTAEVTTFGASTAVLRAALYADDGNGYPTGSPLVDGGTVASETNGVKAWTVSVPVLAGRYHLALVSQAITCTVRSCSGISPWAVIASSATNISGTVLASTTGTFDVAAPSGGGQCPFVGVKVT